MEHWCVRMMGHGVDPLPLVRKVSYLPLAIHYLQYLPDCRESDLFEGGDDTNPSLCHAGEIALLIDGGVFSCTGLTPGSIATVSCEDGYELSGGKGTLVCQDDGTWDGTIPTCVESGTYS